MKYNSTRIYWTMAGACTVQPIFQVACLSKTKQIEMR